MAKFILSNFGDHKLIQKHEISNGFELSGCSDYDVLFSAFRKLKVKSNNYLSIGDDFISSTGTLFYKDKKGIEMLDILFKDYVIYGIGVRNDCVGNYASIIKRGNTISIFGEECYAYDIFYYLNGSDFAVSNDLGLIRNLCPELSVNEDSLLEFAYLNGIIGNETLFNNVYRLSGDQQIIIDIESNNLNISPVSVDWKIIGQNYSEIVTHLCDSLSEAATIIANHCPKVSVCMTGGLDSRIGLASFLAVKSQPDLFYGVGNSFITNTHNRDKEIDSMFAEKYNLTFREWDWRTPEPMDLFWNSYFDKYGILSFAYCASDNIMMSLESSEADFITFGYFGELYRNLPWIETKLKLTIEDFVDEYYFKKNDAGYYIEYFSKDFQHFRKHIINKFYDVATRFHLDPLNLSLEDNVMLMLEYRSNADSLMLNLMNRICYSSYLLSQYRVFENNCASISEMKDSRFILDILDRLCPSVLDIPIFSHERDMVYNRDARKLEYPKSFVFRSWLLGLFPKTLKQYFKKIIQRKQVNAAADTSDSNKVGLIMNYLCDYYGKSKIDSDHVKPIVLCHAMCIRALRK